MEKDTKKYPYNLLRQIFIGESFDKLPDDSCIALEYIISETLTKREALFLRMRYKENMRYADIATAVCRCSSAVGHTLRKAEHKLRHPTRIKRIQMGMHNLIEYVKECERNRLEMLYKGRIAALERENAILRQEEYIPATPEPDIIDEGIEVLDLSVRCYKILRRANIMTVRDLINAEPQNIYNLPNMGKRNFEELLDVLNEKGFADKALEIWRCYENDNCK